MKRMKKDNTEGIFYEVSIKNGRREVVGKFRSRSEAQLCYEDYVMQGFTAYLHKVNYGDEYGFTKYIDLIAKNDYEAEK